MAAKAIGPAIAGKLGDVVIDPRVLPDQRVGHGLAGFAVPQHSGLALVGDSDCRQIGGAKLALLQRLRNHILRGLPDFFGIVLDPPRLRIDLLMLFLRSGYGFAGGVKHAEAGAGRSLIDCADVLSHGGHGTGRGQI